jgi:preprotein translocase subunit SecB
MSNIKVLTQYIKDLSFEIPNAPQIFLNNQEKPNIGISVDIDAKKIANDAYEIALKIKADAKVAEETLFICEVAYCGIFALQNIDENMLEQILLVYCPNLLFPYLRRIVSNMVVDGGFPPLMLDPIDFAALYAKRKEVAASAPINNTKN